MNPGNFPAVMGAITRRPCSIIKQRLRAAREAGHFPTGKEVTLQPRHIARLLFALACEHSTEVGLTINRLRTLPRQTPDGPPGDLETALSSLIDRLPQTPVIGDLDVATGHIAIDAEHGEVAWHVHDLYGRPTVVRFGREPVAPSAVATNVVFPIATLRELSRTFLNEKASHSAYSAAA